MWSDRLLGCLQNGSDILNTVSELAILSDIAAHALERLLLILSRFPDSGAPLLQQQLFTSGPFNRDDKETDHEDDGDHTPIPLSVQIHCCPSLRQWLEMQTRIDIVAVQCRRAQWEAMALGLEPTRDRLLLAFDEARSIAEKFGDLEAVIEVVWAFDRISD